MPADFNPFDALIEQILSEERETRQPETLMAKALMVRPATGKELRLYRRIAEGGRKFERDVAKILAGRAETGEVAKSLKGNTAVDPAADRATKARWIKGRLDELDRCIRAGTVTAIQAAIVESRLNHIAARMGL